MERKKILFLIIIFFIFIVFVSAGTAVIYKFEKRKLNNKQDINNFISNTDTSKKYIKLQSNFLPQSNTSPLNILFFGDLMLDRHVKEKIDAKGFDYLFKELASSTEGNIFSDYNIVAANLEGAVTDEGVHYAPVNAYDFAFAPELINNLKKYNFNFFTVANNHLADQGERGIIETRENLLELGFFYVGCSDRKVGACSTDIIEIAGKKIGMAGYSMVYGKLDEVKVLAQVKILAENTDLVVVNIHWGVEYDHFFNSTQSNLAHNLIDAGADMIIGHHPHVVQGMEIYNNKPIFYSLGNFIFDQYFSSDTQEGLAVGININEDKSSFYLFPLKSKASQPSLMKEEEKKMFFKKFVSWSEIDDNTRELVKTGIIELDK